MFFINIIIFFFCCQHFLACIYGFIGRRDYYDNPRYDGHSFFKGFNSRPYITLGPLADLSMWDQYCVCMYVSTSIMSAATYSDCIPQTLAEQIICCLFMFITNSIRAYLVITISQYYGNQQKHQIQKIKKSNQIELWMESNKLSKKFMKEVKEFTHTIRHEKSLFEGSEVLQNLPTSLQDEINNHLQL